MHIILSIWRDKDQSPISPYKWGSLQAVVVQTVGSARHAAAASVLVLKSVAAAAAVS